MKTLKHSKKMIKKGIAILSCLMLFTAVLLILTVNFDSPNKSEICGDGYNEYYVNAVFPSGRIVSVTNLNILSNEASGAAGDTLKNEDATYFDLEEETPKEYMICTHSFMCNDEETEEPSDGSTGAWPIPDVDNITITYVELTLSSVLNDAHVWHDGHFAFTTDYQYNTSWTYTNTNVAEASWGTLTNSSTFTAFNYPSWGLGGPDPAHGVKWRILELRNWTYDMIFNTDEFRVYWVTTVDSTIQKFDYVGVSVRWTDNIYHIPPENFPDMGFTANIDAAIWVIIVFLPGLVMNQIMPRIGVLIGTSFMLIAVSTMHLSFLPITVIGLASIGVYLYKGER